MKALKYKKEDRYGSAEELGQELLRTLHQRGKLINASDIAAYYELHFGAELTEYRDRMRLLITGKKETAVGEESVNWGTADVEEVISEITIDPDGSMVESIESIEERAAQDKDQPTQPEEASEDATRIETNPLTVSKVLEGVKTEISDGTLPTMADSRSPMERAALSARAAKQSPPRGGYSHGALPSNRTIVPGGLAPLPRASELRAGNKAQAVSGVAVRGASNAAANPITSGPSAKTIAPGQLSIDGPQVGTAAQPAGKKGNEKPTLNLGPKEKQEALAAVAAGQQPRRTVMGVAALKKPGERSANAPLSTSPRAGSAATAGALNPGKRPRAPTVPPPLPAASMPASSGQSAASPSARTLYQAPPPNDVAAAGQRSRPQTSVPPDTMPPVGGAHQAAMAGSAGPHARTIAPGQTPKAGTGPRAPLNGPQQQQQPQSPQLSPGPSPHPSPQQGMARSGPQQPMRPPTHASPRTGWRPTMPTKRLERDNSKLMLLGLVFALSLGVGLGITLLISSLA